SGDRQQCRVAVVARSGRGRRSGGPRRGGYPRGSREMRISTMRLVDRWLGIPVCVALTVLRRVRDRGRAPAPAPPRSIAFVKLAEQGSTVLACSAIRRAVELVGREHVFFVVFEQNRFILDVMALIPPRNVVTIDANGVLATVAGAVTALRRLRRLGVD